jgi:HTH-type transcriptional regulator/antitoxin HigA
MAIEPIKTEADCDAALRRIEELWDAPGTPAGDELDALATLVEAYEKKEFDEDEDHARA